MRRPRILHGVCGIGNGHTYRQLPLIEHFAATADIVVFAYGDSLAFYRKRFAAHPHVTVEPVSVPFYRLTPQGMQADTPPDDALNRAAMERAQRRLGTPDLVITDYEPVSAQYAYHCNAPLITIDQQSKYLSGDFPAQLNGCGYEDEVARLRLFFPKAARRIACSFFQVAAKTGARETVDIVPPVLSDRIMNLTRHVDDNATNILIYISAQQPFGQSLNDIAAACRAHPGATFHIFGRNLPAAPEGNLKTYNHGDPRFDTLLSSCNGIVSTAGHSLLSEAMHLGIPVYAIPLPLYEQQMNAHVIGQNGFGLSRPAIDAEGLGEFIRNIPAFESAIRNDRAILLRRPGQADVLRILNSYLIPG